jgi:hypothetical protein
VEGKLCELLDHEVGAVEADRRRHSIGTATVKIPAAFAAFTPFGDSSKAIASGRATTHKPARGDLTAIDQRPNRYGRWSKWGGTSGATQPFTGFGGFGGNGQNASEVGAI